MLFASTISNLILLLSEWHCAMLILELRDLCVVEAEPGNRPHSGMRNDKKQTLREEKEREEEEDREQVLSCVILLSRIPDFSHFIPSLLFFFILSTYMTLGRLRISFLDLSGAECLLQRRWMQLKKEKEKENKQQRSGGTVPVQ